MFMVYRQSHRRVFIMGPCLSAYSVADTCLTDQYVRSLPRALRPYYARHLDARNKEPLDMNIGPQRRAPHFKRTSYET